MKIAVITPTVGPGDGSVSQCISSVDVAAIHATGHECHHVVVYDGTPENQSSDSYLLESGLGLHCLRTGERANNAGATPRALGSCYATGTLKADVVAFLDDDCTMSEGHLANAIQLIERGAEVVTSLRYMCEYDTGKPMYIDTNDSDGTNFADTNTIVMGGNAAKFGSTFDWPAPYRKRCAESGADRVFWERIKHSFTRTRVCTGQPTIMYRTPWLCHYRPPFTPPAISKLVALNEHGDRVAKRVRPKQLWVQKDGAWHRFIELRGDEVRIDDTPHDDDGLVVFGSIGWEVEDA